MRGEAAKRSLTLPHLASGIYSLAADVSYLSAAPPSPLSPLPCPPRRKQPTGRPGHVSLFPGVNSPSQSRSWSFLPPCVFSPGCTSRPDPVSGLVVPAAVSFKHTRSRCCSSGWLPLSQHQHHSPVISAARRTSISQSASLRSGHVGQSQPSFAVSDSRRGQSEPSPTISRCLLTNGVRTACRWSQTGISSGLQDELQEGLKEWTEDVTNAINADVNLVLLYIRLKKHKDSCLTDVYPSCNWWKKIYSNHI